jgi:hypothetical protein
VVWPWMLRWCTPDCLLMRLIWLWMFSLNICWCTGDCCYGHCE